MIVSDGWTSRVIEAIASADQPARVFHKRWHRARHSEVGGVACAYCSAALDLDTPRAAVLDYLIPLHHGGPETDFNRVIACPSCERAKGNKDLLSWMSWKPASDADRAKLLALRLKILAVSANHLTHTRAGAPLSAVRRHLEKRFASPRFCIYVVHGEEVSWIGWTARCGAKEVLGMAAGILRYQFDAIPVGSDLVNLFELPSVFFFDAVWALIDQHAFVRSVGVEGQQAPLMDQENWQHHWQKHFTHVGDLARRRERMTGNNPWTPGTPANAKMRFFRYGVLPDPSALIESELPPTAPSPPRKFSDAPRSVARRAKRDREVEVERRQAFLEARAALDGFKEDVRSGRLEEPTPEEMDLMERGVLAFL